MDPIDNKDSQDKTIISEVRNEIKKIQKLYQCMNCSPTNLLFDAALRHIFIGFKFDKDTHSQYECPSSNRSRKWSYQTLIAKII